MAISSVTNRNDAGQYAWNKKAQDVNDIDEVFNNARDIGYLRLNVSRVSVVGKLGKFNNVDMYKVQVQSAGKLSLSLRASTEEEDKPVLDLSKYEEDLREAERMADPEGYAERLAKELEEEENQKLLSYTAPGMKVEVYMKKNGRNVLVAESGAAEGSKLDTAMRQILTGEYKAAKGDYYVKVSYDETADTKARKEQAYAMQLQVGDKYKHDYLTTQQDSEDTKNKQISKIPSSLNNGTLSVGNVLLIQAGRNEAAANMLIDGYLNMSSIYNKNSGKF